jgi:hypothetical protein
MATLNLPGGEGKAAELTPIVGTPLSEDELKQIPRQSLFYYSSVKPSLWDGFLDFLVVFQKEKPRKRRIRCPLCKPKDPDVTVLVMNACALGTASPVNVQCVRGHWAAYSCQGT